MGCFLFFLYHPDPPFKCTLTESWHISSSWFGSILLLDLILFSLSNCLGLNLNTGFLMIFNTKVMSLCRTSYLNAALSDQEADTPSILNLRCFNLDIIYITIYWVWWWFLNDVCLPLPGWNCSKFKKNLLGCLQSLHRTTSITIIIVHKSYKQFLTDTPQ